MSNKLAKKKIKVVSYEEYYKLLCLYEVQREYMDLCDEMLLESGVKKDELLSIWKEAQKKWENKKKNKNVAPVAK